MTFQQTLEQFDKEMQELKKLGAELQARSKIVNEKLGGFFKENGLPENFTMTELALLALRKGKSDLITSA